MDRREFLGKSAVAAMGMAGTAVSAEKAESAGQAGRPNILMITAHDLGRHLGCYGVKTVNSPNIDRLANEGIRFANYFAADCVCSPSRGVILTGRYPQSNGLMGLTHAPWNWKFKEGERHMAAILRDAGYSTTLVGLQHVTQGDPKELGYERVLSRKHIAEETVRAACEELAGAGKGGKPFFMKVGFMEVHRPFKNGTDTSKGVYIPPFLQDTPEIREDLAQYQGTIRFFDKCVGRILDGLRSSDVADNTLVVFTIDHGIPYPGAKWCLYDPGMETPLILYMPKSRFTGGKVFSELMSNLDLLPTLLDIVGVEIPANLQGVSFKRLIYGVSNDPPRTEVYAQRTSHALRDNTSRAIRTLRYKLIRYFEAGRVIIFPTDAVPQRVAEHVERPRRRSGQRPVVQLFDIVDDPHERNDLAAKPQYAAIVRELSDKLWSWMEQVGDPILQGPLRTPYYEEAIADYHEFRSRS